MGGCSVVDEMEQITSELTLVLVGKTGNGKSATGNSLLGTKIFESKRSGGGVTITSDLKTTNLDDGRILNVIDTPGMFDSSADPNFIAKEIVSCVEMARDGIHGVLVVFSVCNRFSDDENDVIRNLANLFGSNIYDYMIIVFTGGDELEEDGKSLEDFIHDSPKSLKKTLSLCGNRYVLFDNRTNNQTKKAKQVEELLFYVDKVLQKNGGRPYTNDLFTEFKKRTMEFKEQKEQLQGLKDTKNFSDLEMLALMEQIRDKQLKLLIEMFERQMKETTSRLEKLIKEEQAARGNAEERAREQQTKSEEEIRKLKEKLEKKGWCVIM